MITYFNPDHSWVNIKPKAKQKKIKLIPYHEDHLSEIKIMPISLQGASKKRLDTIYETKASIYVKWPSIITLLAIC